jgi:hypothetical protein
MNPEIESILKTLRAFHPGLKLDMFDAVNIQKVIAIEAARLNAILAEEQRRSAEILEGHTKALLGPMEALLRETKALRWLTVGLLILTAGLLVFTVFLAVGH